MRDVRVEGRKGLGFRVERRKGFSGVTPMREVVWCLLVIGRVCGVY